VTLLVTDALYLKHQAPRHPECPERVTAMIERLHETGLWDRVRHLPARDATEDELRLVHTADHVKRIRSAKPGRLDEDTYVNDCSAAAAIRAVGGVVAACEAVADGGESTAFCLVRPPGHHATPDRAMGFCLFNNVAIAARKLKRRVFVIDWDVHHGNGTQDIFWSDPTVFYLSTHRWPFWPGTGAAGERGAGNIRNLPLPKETTRQAFVAAFEEAVRSTARSFKPEFVILSCGFDAYVDDPIGGLNLLPEDFATMTRIVRSLGVPVVSALEGGYALDALGRCAEEHLSVLLE